MEQSATEFSDDHRTTIMTLATLRAVAVSHGPATRLLGPVRCDDLIRAVDDLIPLEEGWPGRTREIAPLHLYSRRPWRDGQPSEEVLMGVLECAMHWAPEAQIAGPLYAGEIAGAAYHVLTGQRLDRAATPEPAAVEEEDSAPRTPEP